MTIVIIINGRDFPSVIANPYLKRDDFYNAMLQLHTLGSCRVVDPD
jgi:hypothetical protein